MKLLPSVTVALTLLLLAPPVLHSQASDATTSLLWSGDGNNFLARCDETDSLFPASQAARINGMITCDSWIAGLAEGILLTQTTDVDPLRSELGLLSADAKKLIAANQEAAANIAAQLNASGAEQIATPDADMCLSSSIPIDQIRRVVIKWMKDNPKNLNQSTPLLVFAALKNVYPCQSK